MDVLRILGIIAVVIVALVVYYAFESRCEEVLGEKLLTASAAYWMAGAVWLAYVGYSWRQTLLNNGGDALNGTLIVACAVLLTLSLVASNFVRLRLFFGTVRTVLQFLLLPLTVPLLPLYPVWVLWKRLTGPVPVRIVRDE